MGGRPNGGPALGQKLQTAEKSRGWLEIRRFSDRMNRLGATYFWKKNRNHETIEKFSKNFKKISKKFLKKFLKKFRIFRKLFVRFVRSKIFPEIGRAETIRLVQKSSNFEPSSRFFGRLKTESSETKVHSLY